MTIFYDDLIDLGALDQELTSYVEDPAERAEIIEILDQSLHHVVMDVIFRNLPADVHELWLVQFTEDPSRVEHLDFLRQYQPTIEDMIRVAATESKQRFIDTIHA